MRVLIVDDNESMCALLASLLAGQGHEVVGTLGDGSRVMETIRAATPDVVCLDYDLPGRDGLDLLAEINATVPRIDVMMITASEDPAVRARAADAGAAGFIQKPFGQGQILDELAQILEARRMATEGEQRAAAMPAPEPASPGGAAPAPAAEPRLPFNRKATVIVDDNSAIRLLMKGLLTDLGLTVVHSVANGADAVAAAKRFQPGILCLDVDMPVMSGLDALPLIREASPRTAVVMVTANATRDFVEKAIAGGARGYILKPLRPAYVEAFMKKLLSGAP